MKPRLGDDPEDGRQLLGGLGVAVTSAAGGGSPFRAGGASVLKRQRENRAGANAPPSIDRSTLPPGVNRQ